MRKDGTIMNATTNQLPAYIEKNGITYQLVGDIYLPLIAVEDKPRRPLGYWGRLRWKFLKQERSGTYAELLLTSKLFDHLAEIEDAAIRRREELIRNMAEDLGITEQLKAKSPLEWAARMNELDGSVREIICDEMIFCWNFS